jgi:hypothetical protein
MQIRLGIFGLILLTVSACSVFHKKTPESKMDLRLRQAVASQTEVIAFSGECSAEIDEAVKQKLEVTGIAVQTGTGMLFTGRGNADAVKKLAALKEIVKLQSGKPVKPLVKQGGQP